MNLRVNVALAWVLVIFNLIMLSYLVVLYVQDEYASDWIKSIQGGLTFAIWVILISDIFALKLKDRWFWAISVTVLLPIVAPVYLWRRSRLIQNEHVN